MRGNPRCAVGDDDAAFIAIPGITPPDLGVTVAGN
jgi:hypothetical protein